MDGHIFIAPGDITQIAADAIAYSASTLFGGSGSMYSAYRDQIPGFGDWYGQLGRDHAGQCRTGDVYWMPLRVDARPHGVVVVIATGGPATDEDKAAIAVRAAIAESVGRLRADGHSGRLLIALPAFRVGMGGDRDHTLRSARAQVEEARRSLGGLPGVDVVFVTYTPALYRVFL